MEDQVQEDHVEQPQAAAEPEQPSAEQAPAEQPQAQTPEATDQAEQPEAAGGPEQAAQAEEQQAATKPRKQTTPPPPPVDPRKRHEERVAERRRKAVARRRLRLQLRERRRAQRAERPGEGGQPPRQPASTGRKRIRQGVVLSAKAAKTITVEIPIARRHPRYEKIVRASRKLHAHDEHGEAHEGDVVRVIESRPLSRTKRWRLLEVVERAR